jgi:hypothetical protein
MGAAGLLEHQRTICFCSPGENRLRWYDMDSVDLSKVIKIGVILAKRIKSDSMPV